MAAISRIVRRAVHDRRAPLLVRGEREPHAVAVLRRQLVEVAEQTAVRAVVREDVVPAVLDAGRERLQLLQRSARSAGVTLGQSVCRAPGPRPRPARRGGRARSRSSSSARASASRTWADTWMSRACSSHVYQVTPTAESCATSSRRSPGVRRRRPRRQPDLLGGDALAAAAQESGELVPPDVRLAGGRMPSGAGGGARRGPGPRAHAHRSPPVVPPSPRSCSSCLQRAAPILLPGTPGTRIRRLWYPAGEGDLARG